MGKWLAYLFFTISFHVAHAEHDVAPAQPVALGKSELAISQNEQRLIASLSPCECHGSPLSREGGDQVLGEASLKDLHGHTFPVSVMNDEFALKLFQEMTAQGGIPFGFPEDGCFARAHEMAMQMEKKHVFVGKVFATGKFKIATEKAEKGRVTWSFHVAPVIVVDDGKTKHLWVIDPSLFGEPASLVDWLKALTANPSSTLESVYLTNRFVYHPREKNRVMKGYDPDDLKSMRHIMKRYLKTEQKRIKAASDLIF